MNITFSALGWGLHLAAELLIGTPMSSSKEKIIVMLTDGYKNQGPDPIGVSEMARNLNDIIIFGVGITPNSNISEIQALSNSPKHVFEYGTTGKEIVEAMKIHLYSRVTSNMSSTTCVVETRLTLAFTDDLIIRNVSTKNRGDWAISNGFFPMLQWNIGDIMVGDTASLSFVVEACGCTNPIGLVSTHDFALLTSKYGLNEILPKFPGGQFMSGKGVEGCSTTTYNYSMANNKMVILQGEINVEGRVSGPYLMSDVQRAISDLFNRTTTGELGLPQVIQDGTLQSLLPSNESDVHHKDFGRVSDEVESNYSLLQSNNATKICGTQPVKAGIESKEYCLCQEGELKNCNGTFKFCILFESISKATDDLELLLRPKGLAALSTSLNVPAKAIVIRKVSAWMLAGGKILNHEEDSSYITYSKLSRGYRLNADNLKDMKVVPPTGPKGISRVWVIVFSIITIAIWVSVAYWTKTEVAHLRLRKASAEYTTIPAHQK